MIKHKLFSLAAALILLFSGATAQAAGLEFKSYEQAVKEAEAEKKMIMVFFWADWCRYCVQLRKDVFQNDKVKEAFDKSFVGVSVDVENPADQELNKFRASNALPTITFLKPDGEPYGYFDGATDPDTFIQILNMILKGDS